MKDAHYCALPTVILSDCILFTLLPTLCHTDRDLRVGGGGGENGMECNLCTCSTGTTLSSVLSLLHIGNVRNILQISMHHDECIIDICCCAKSLLHTIDLCYHMLDTSLFYESQNTIQLVLVGILETLTKFRL
ncbi:hypothetical protein F5Y12DRAFT_292869 [Xylaria sp. FL1777]|nr:hypothetical protein F5Y12DRAFT_292869 [Xylaria sp. FL1777]